MSGFYLMLVTLAAWASFQRFTQLAVGIRVVVALMCETRVLDHPRYVD
jgi:hypothetical protein